MTVTLLDVGYKFEPLILAEIGGSLFVWLKPEKRKDAHKERQNRAYGSNILKILHKHHLLKK